MASFGALSMFLAGGHSPQHATNQCSANSPRTTAAVIRSGQLRTTHVAHNPVLLDAAAQAIGATPGSGTPTPSLSNGSPSPGVLPNPTPVNQSPGSDSPSPSSPGASSSVPTPPVSPGGTNKTPTPSASPTSTSTPTSTPTPTPTKTSSSPGQLCLSVQTLGGSNTVNPDTNVHYAIWVWLTSGNDGTAKVKLSASHHVAPVFSVCEPSGRSSCSVGGLNANQRVELQAKLKAPKDLAGRHITLTVTATSAQASNSASASDRIRVRSKSTGSSSSQNSSTAGDGGSLSGGSFSEPGLPGGTSFPGETTSPTGNLGTAFPQVSPSPGASSSATSRNHQHPPLRATDLSAGLPLDVRLIGGQVIGLAILAAAVTIAVARLSLRKQPAKHDDGGSGSGS
jgi:hypothetical protein